jgi:hypothetical protein
MLAKTVSDHARLCRRDKELFSNFYKNGSGHHLATTPEPDQETSKDKSR